jgi:hypothetical protein
MQNLSILYVQFEQHGKGINGKYYWTLSPSWFESRAVTDVTFIAVTVVRFYVLNIKNVFGWGVEKGVKL